MKKATKATKRTSEPVGVDVQTIAANIAERMVYPSADVVFSNIIESEKNGGAEEAYWQMVEHFERTDCSYVVERRGRNEYAQKLALLEIGMAIGRRQAGGAR